MMLLAIVNYFAYRTMYEPHLHLVFFHFAAKSINSPKKEKLTIEAPYSQIIVLLLSMTVFKFIIELYALVCWVKSCTPTAI